MDPTIQTKNSKESSGICFSRSGTNAISHRSCTFGTVRPPENKFRSGYWADVVSTNDYYPFGMGMVERGDDGSYRYGFNGMQRDDEWQGAGNAYDFGARMYDGRLGRWMSVDAHASNYPFTSGYIFSLNSPLLFNDPDGMDARVTVQKDPNGGGKIIIATTVYIVGPNASEFQEGLFNRKAKIMYESGTYTDENGHEFDIEFNVTFEYVEDRSKIESVDGDNILYFSDKEVRSHINGSVEIVKTKRGSEEEQVITKYLTGNQGIISKDDGFGATWRPTIHEVLHFLGLSDRYEDKGRNSEPDEGFKDDLMGSYWGNSINQVHFDNIGRAFAGKEEGTYILKERVDVDPKNGTLIGGSSHGEDANRSNDY